MCTVAYTEYVQIVSTPQLSILGITLILDVFAPPYMVTVSANAGNSVPYICSDVEGKCRVCIQSQT